MSTIVEALRWYAAEAESLARHMKETLLKDREHTQAVLASLTVLSLDAGKRARAALAQPVAEPLTNKQIAMAMLAVDDPLQWGHLGEWNSNVPLQFARAIEAAHGIGKKTP